MKKQAKADISLLLITVTWGASFILSKDVLTEVPTYNFLAIRFIIAFIVSSLIFIKQMVKINKSTLKYGVILGILLFSSYGLQTVGLTYTTASKCAFITGFSVVLVPLFSSIMMKNRPEKKVYLSVILAFVGLTFLTVNKNIGNVNIGDIYTLISAGLFAFYIILVGKYTVKVESISLAVLQMGIVGFLSLLTSFLVEKPVMPTNNMLWINILILSVVCTSVAYIVQGVAQKFTSPTHTALIYTAEPVFAGIFSYIIYGEVLSIKGIIGATLILLAMLISEVDFKILFNKVNLEEVS